MQRLIKRIKTGRKLKLRPYIRSMNIIKKITQAILRMTKIRTNNLNTQLKPI
ncbi:Uncharacterised protein [Legionella pneumophila]|nr:Uncharacterised protein [Legionella pneumophila]STX46704.1 Uncharacterised protein [Legionella hackeliae]CZG78441.1 Uncharacterised protein [Legionella pneumophila]CZG79753.1 Uncharacterised protein [Legionella pneumophila]CZG83412.1 Uncharacterised protein [Legionella pneumophila]